MDYQILKQEIAKIDVEIAKINAKVALIKATMTPEEWKYFRAVYKQPKCSKNLVKIN